MRATAETLGPSPRRVTPGPPPVRAIVYRLVLIRGDRPRAIDDYIDYCISDAVPWGHRCPGGRVRGGARLATGSRRG